MKFLFPCAQLLIANTAHAALNSSSEALNKTNYNLVPQALGGPILYYNGTGDVPAYTKTSPDPVPITPVDGAPNSTSEDAFFEQMLSITNGSSSSDNCTKCLAGVEIMHMAASSLPVSSFVNLTIQICNAVTAVKNSIYAVNCAAEFGSTQNTSISPFSSGGAGTGAYYAQLFSRMSASTGDFDTYCHYQWNVCPQPATIGIQEDLYFSPKPASANAVPAESSQSFNVLHISDWHIDPRFDIGSEGNCSQYMCCRPFSTNTQLGTNANNASVPASRFGSMHCDSPPDLVLSSMSTMPTLFNTSSVAFSIFTGDIVSHDDDDQLSRDYVSYSEEITYRTLHAYMNFTPVYATLGNHDTLPVDMYTQNTLNPDNGTLSNAFSWNYELLSSLWSNYSWLNTTEADYASTHYAAYAHTTTQGLRIISLNTEFWYTNNPFNYWNVTNPDTSGILSWLAHELSACESRNQRAWIIGHVLSGYNGVESLPNPTALFYSIVRRFSPTTIAGVFFGHTHEDQIQLFYDYLPNSTYVINGITYRNTTMIDYTKPLQVGYIGPSITPIAGLNSGYQLYEVDSATFSIRNINTFFANMSNANSWTTPIWQFEYDARTVYAQATGGVNNNASSWPATALLNATFWDNVATSMLTNATLVELYNLYETKSSVMTPNCTSAECQRQKVCFIRSGSSTLGRACGKSLV